MFDRLKRPYDYRVLIEAYINAQRPDLNFTNYYASLLDVLQSQFNVQLSEENLSFNQRVLWMLFRSTVRSLLQITNPWAGYLEDTLLTLKLMESGQPGEVVDNARAEICEANVTSEAAHREILYALFRAIFGESQRIVTSDELRAVGFDDSREPDIHDYYRDM
jgi:hypothetical protein